TDSKYFITTDAGKIVELDQFLKTGLKLLIKNKEKSDFTIKDLLKKKGNQEIDFYFNGSRLSVPDQIWSVEVNGEKVELDYQIEAGDQIRAFSRTLTIAGVFEYINYNISEKMKNKMEILLNGKVVDLKTKIKAEDKLKVKLNI
ncbi:MAG: cell division FtsA domain-containing protein, partial [Bacillota bacterium]